MKNEHLKRLLQRETKIAVIGLGYVGLPLAHELSKDFDVIGFDTNSEKIALYKTGIDPTNELGSSELSTTTVNFTNNAEDLLSASVHIVAVPTPITSEKTPDLTPVISATETVGTYLTSGSVVVFESTVYPGVTEDICVPILERLSGLTINRDFKVGYSPERINPGDRVNTLRTIKKIVSGSDSEALDIIDAVYSMVVDAGTYPVSSIRTAEAIKVVENAQRDVNIAFMNELALVFDRMNIDTDEVVQGMNTKWNSLGFRPGLVGGHCIGVDPYYFIYEAEKLGYHSQIILSGRKINDSIAPFIAERTVKELIRAGQTPSKSNVYILGLTFKENCPDVRNSKVLDIYKTLQEYGIEAKLVDPWASPEDIEILFGKRPVSLSQVTEADCLILAVGHEQFREMDIDELLSLFRTTNHSLPVLIDVKALLPKESTKFSGIHYWRL